SRAPPCTTCRVPCDAFSSSESRRPRQVVSLHLQFSLPAHTRNDREGSYSCRSYDRRGAALHSRSVGPTLEYRSSEWFSCFPFSCTWDAGVTRRQRGEAQGQALLSLLCTRAFLALFHTPPIALSWRESQSVS